GGAQPLPDDGGSGPLRRGVRRHPARGVRGPRHQGPLCEGRTRRGQGPHRHRRPVRAAPQPRAGAGHRPADGRGERPPHSRPPGGEGVRARLRPAPRRLRAVLLDWDGTIVDSAEASFRCYVRLFDSYRIPFDRERFQRTYSPDWYRTYEALGLPRECWAEADARWLGFYAGEENVILGGAREALKRLDEAGIRLGLVTSGTRSRVARELEGLKMGGLFRVVVSAEDVERRKPDPEPLRRGLEFLGMPAAEAAYVGD